MLGPIVDLAATVLEVLPARLSLASSVLQAAGLCGVIGSAISLLKRRGLDASQPPAPIAELANVGGAVLGVVVFFALYALQELS